MSGYEQLIAKAAAGDKAAFEEIYRRTCKKVYFTCMSFLKNEQDAADVSQEVYIIVMRSLPTLKDPSGFESWIGRITINKCKDFLKKNRPVPVDDETLTGLIDGENSELSDELMLPEEYVTNEAKRKIIMDILKDNLSDILYQTVVLFYFHDMSAAEIAQMMDCPVGTVTSRLCIARAKIKEGVQNYEKKNGDKLYSVALVPVLAAILMAEAHAMEPVSVCANVLSATSNITTTTGAAASQTVASTQAASSASSAAGAMKVATTGGKAMLQTLKAKIIASILALVVIGGGITAAVVISNNSEDEKKVESTQEGDLNDNSDKNPDGTLKGENGSDNKVGVDVEALKDSYDDEIINAADKVKKELNNYFIALQEGDIDTLLALTKPDTVFADYLEAFNETSWGSEFISSIYSGITWGFDEHWDDYMCRKIEFPPEEDFYMSYFLYTTPTARALTGVYLENAPEWAIIESTDEYYVVAQNSEPSNEEMLEVIRDLMQIHGYMAGVSIKITPPDEKGNFYIDFDWTAEIMELELYNVGDAQEKGEDFLGYYFRNDIETGVRDAYVGTDFGIEYPVLDEEIAIMASYLENNDFDGYKSWLEELTGKDYDSEYKELNYPVYDELTDSQKEWVDKYLETKVQFCSYEYVEEGYSQNYIYGMYILKYVVDCYGDITEWALENDCREWIYMQVGEDGASMADLGYYEDSEEDIIKVFEEFLAPYYSAIKYASRYIE